jgi:hypothetical protein
MRITAQQIECRFDENEVEILAYSLKRSIEHGISTHWNKHGIGVWEKDHNAQKEREMMRRFLSVIGCSEAAKGYDLIFERMFGEEAG